MSQKVCVEEEIDGHMFQIYMLAPRTAFDVLAELGNILGPSIGVAIDMADSDAKGELTSKAFELFFKNYNSSKGQNIISKLASKTLVDGKDLGRKENFDALFQGRMGLLFQWLLFSLKSQFSDFFDTMGDVLGDQNLGGQMQQVFKSQSTSVG